MCISWTIKCLIPQYLWTDRHGGTNGRTLQLSLRQYQKGRILVNGTMNRNVKAGVKMKGVKTEIKQDILRPVRYLTHILNEIKGG